MPATQLQSPVYFEYAKVRIEKILRDNHLESLSKQFTTYPAIAAINSKLSSPIVAESDIASDDAVYASITDLNTLRAADQKYFDIVTSTEFMFALTNALTPVAWDSASYIENWRDTSKGKTIAVEATKAVVAYAAALEVRDADGGDGAVALNTTNGPVNHLIFKCIMGELASTEVCPTGVEKFTNNNVKKLLTLPVMYGNELGTDPDDTLEPGVDELDGGSSDDTILAGLAVSATGYWDKFETYFPRIADTFTSKSAFFDKYNNVAYARAVTPDQYASFHTSIYKLNEMDFLSELFKSPTASLINQGIITFTEANSDYGTGGNKYLQALGFRKFAEKMPLASDPNSSIWSQYSDDVWFSSFANRQELGEMIRKGEVSFCELEAIQTSTAANSGNGIFGQGAGNGGATAANFYNKYATNKFALEQIGYGVTINMHCAGDGACLTSFESSSVTNTDLLDHEHSNVYDCAFSPELTQGVLNDKPFWCDANAKYHGYVTNICVDPA